MSANRIPEHETYEQMAEFWDTHSLADYWDQTEPANFEVAEDLRRRFLVAVDRDLLSHLRKLAQVRGISTESLVNLLLAKSLGELESAPATA